MTAAIPILQSDHVNFASLLNVLERQINVAEDSGIPSVELIKLVLAYFRDYPRKVHHPKEDLIYGALLPHLQNQASSLFNVIQDHRELSERIETLEQSLWAVDSGSPASLAESLELFCNQARRFIDKEREHMAMEEGHLYPSAVQHLSPEEWAGIDKFMANEKDLLFSGPDSSQYKKLRDEISALDNIISRLQ